MKRCCRPARGSDAIAHRWILEPHAQLAFHARVRQPSRLVHERIKLRRKRSPRFLAIDAGRTRQSELIGDEIEIIAHFLRFVVARVIAAARAASAQGGYHDAREIVRVNVIDKSILVRRDRGRAALEPRERQTPGCINSRRAQYRDADSQTRAPAPDAMFGISAPSRTIGLRPQRPRLVDERAPAIAVNATRAHVNEPLWYTFSPRQRCDQVRGSRIVQAGGGRRRKVHNVLCEASERSQGIRPIEIPSQRFDAELTQLRAALAPASERV